LDDNYATGSTTTNWIFQLESCASYKRLNVGYHGYVSHIPDVEVVCFGLVNKNPVGCSSSTGWLHDVTVNQQESGCRYGTWLNFVKTNTTNIVSLHDVMLTPQAYISSLLLYDFLPFVTSVRNQATGVCHHTTTPPHHHTTTVYGPFSGISRASQCQKRTSGLYGARGD